MNPLVLYHANCNDGFCAAWLIRKVFNEPELIPMQHGQEPPDVTGRIVYLIDFSFKRDVIIEMNKKAKCIHILDHHKTALEELGDLNLDAFYKRFDMNKSGARITQEFFDLGKSWLVDYTEDRDLWNNKLPRTDEVNAALRSYPLDFDVWNDLDKKGVDFLAKEGEAILRYEKMLVRLHVDNAQEVVIDGMKVLGANASVLTSDIAGTLAKNRPFGVIWRDKEGVRVWSLRSDENGMDVSAIAKKHGGGGHFHASSYSEPLT